MSDNSKTTLREIPLSRIVVPEGFNPRGAVIDDADLHALSETIRDRGVLQPILVRPASDGNYALIAGERRYRAASNAGLTVIPAAIRERAETGVATGTEAEAEQAAADAVIENELRVPLNPVERARGYRQVMAGGLTVRGVAQRLGGRVPVTRVRETLAILDLPEDVQPQVADGTIPVSAVRALVKLTRIHTGLPGVAVRRVVDGPPHTWDTPTTWDDVSKDPIGVVCGGYDDEAGDLPSDVYLAGHVYPVDRFALGEDARNELGELCEPGRSAPGAAFESSGSSGGFESFGWSPHSFQSRGASGSHSPRARSRSPSTSSRRSCSARSATTASVALS